MKTRQKVKATLNRALFSFGGQDFAIVDRTALWWPAPRALLVADLHLEKGSWFAARGQMLPPYDSLATLDRLTRLVAQLGAQEVWALGDNFHDQHGPARMADATRARLSALTQALAFHWITGNHDEELPEAIGGTIVSEAMQAGLILRHHADPLELRPELSGHWHPKVKISARSRRVSRPCFVMGQNRLILPAFGAYAGGMAADDPAIMTLVGHKAVALLAQDDTVLRFPLG